MIDDAHGIGVMGPGGQGSVAAAGLGQEEVPILMGTLGKALGTSGAFVAGSEELVETLIQQARSYIYTTAMPPAVAEATRASLRIVAQEEWRRERLQGLVARFRHGAQKIGLDLMDSQTPIQPVMLGSTERANRWSGALHSQGILVGAIRPPTVPEGSARLRITFSSSHTASQVEALLSVLDEIAADESA
jgi:8-amino-7-oxononanoate synthase